MPIAAEPRSAPRRTRTPSASRLGGGLGGLGGQGGQADPLASSERGILAAAAAGVAGASEAAGAAEAAATLEAAAATMARVRAVTAERPAPGPAAAALRPARPSS